jgi:hypothetical protein
MLEKLINYLLGDALGKITPYNGKVYIPCKKCHNLVKVGINEKLVVCPFCGFKE